MVLSITSLGLNRVFACRETMAFAAENPTCRGLYPSSLPLSDLGHRWLRQRDYGRWRRVSLTSLIPVLLANRLWCGGGLRRHQVFADMIINERKRIWFASRSCHKAVLYSRAGYSCARSCRTPDINQIRALGDRSLAPVGKRRMGAESPRPVTEGAPFMSCKRRSLAVASKLDPLRTKSRGSPNSFTLRKSLSRCSGNP